MIWAIAQQVGTQAVNYLIFVTLVLLLDPKELGLLGVAMVWISFLQIFSDIGFSAALIQRREIEPRHLSTTFFINVGLGGLLSAIAFALSQPVAFFFKHLELQPIIETLSVVFLINSFSLTHIAVAQRALKFRGLAIRDILASLAGGVVAIIFAYHNYGVWSLVAQQLVTCITGTLLFWYLSSWRPEVNQFSLESLSELWRYGSKIFFFNLFKFSSQNVDKILIGYLLSATALGIYTFAYKIVVFPAISIVGAVGVYLFPKLSRIQDELHLIQTSYLLLLKATTAIIFPSMITVFVLSPTVVPLFFGERWISAIPIMQILAIVAVMQSLISPVGQLMKAMNHPDWLLLWSIGFTIVTVLCIAVGSYWGMIGISIGLVIIHILGLSIITIIIARLTSINFSLVLNALWPMIAALSVFCFLLGLTLFIYMQLETNRVAVGLIGVMISTALYVIILNWLDKSFISAGLAYLSGRS